MTDNTEAGLLDDIIANPADDVPRLIYADWLEEHDRRLTAQCIRRQIAGEIGVPPLRDIANVVEPMGVGGIGRRVASPGCCTWTSRCGIVQIAFRRGFLAEIHGPLTVLLEHLPRLVREQPIERVRVTDATPIELTSGLGFRWMDHGTTFVTVGSGTHNGHLPREVWLCLPPDQDGDKPDPAMVRAMDYPTADAAHAALSVALLRRARGLTVEVTA